MGKWIESHELDLTDVFAFPDIPDGLNSEKSSLRLVWKKRMERYQELAAQLEDARQEERMQLWTDVGSSDLIPGLPNELVESLIWPRVRQHVEEVRRERHVEAGIIERLQLIRSLAHTSQKWRHLVRHSKPWGGFRLLMQSWPSHYWTNFPDILSHHFISILLYLPPLDIFYRGDRKFLSRWLNA